MICIESSIYNQIKLESEKSYPDECCGFIFGKTENERKITVMIKPNVNKSVKEEQFHRFVITAEDMMNQEIYARKNGLEIIGFYHSHPDCQAVPSEYDRKNALPIYSYIIVSCMKGSAKDVNCYNLSEESGYTQFEREEIFMQKGE